MIQLKQRTDRELDLSIAIPMLNEQDNVVALYEEICQVMSIERTSRLMGVLVDEANRI